MPPGFRTAKTGGCSGGELMVGDGQVMQALVEDFDTQAWTGKRGGQPPVPKDQRLNHRFPGKQERGKRAFQIDQFRPAGGKVATRRRENAGFSHVAAQLAANSGRRGHLPDPVGSPEAGAFGQAQIENLAGPEVY